MTSGFGDWNAVSSRGREVRKVWSVGSIEDVARGEGRLPLVVCCSSRDEIEGLGLGKERERGGGRSADSPSDFLLCSFFSKSYFEEYLVVEALPPSPTQSMTLLMNYM